MTEPYNEESTMKTRHDEMLEQAKKYHAEHPEVWDAFVDFTFDRIKKGYNNYSVYSIMERIRWDMGQIGGDGITEFKIGNNHRPFYARWFMEQYPEHAGFFRTRQQKSHMNPATGLDMKPDMVK